MAWGKCSENEWTDFVKKVIEAAVKMKATKADFGATFAASDGRRRARDHADPKRASRAAGGRVT